MDYFMQEAKIKRRIQEIEALRVSKQASDPAMVCHRGSDKVSGNIRHSFSTEQVMHIGETWQGRDRIYGFKRKSPFPEDEYIVFDFGKTGGGNNSGFESLLFIDGVPVQGIDANHKEFLLEPANLGKRSDRCAEAMVWTRRRWRRTAADP